MAYLVVADDEPGVRDLLAQVFADEGIEVQVAGSGTEAIGQLRSREEAPVALLLDLNMPDGRVQEVIRYVSARWPARPVPVVLMTGWDQLPEWIDHRVQVVRKPFHVLRLREQILERWAVRGEGPRRQGMPAVLAGAP